MNGGKTGHFFPDLIQAGADLYSNLSTSISFLRSLCDLGLFDFFTNGVGLKPRPSGAILANTEEGGRGADCVDLLRV